MAKRKEKSTTEPTTLLEAVRYFKDPDNCINYIVKYRWPDGVTCPMCGSKNVRWLATRRLWWCTTTHARQQFSVKVGTVMEDSAIPLDKWLPAIWMLSACKNGVSSHEIKRAVGVTQKSAWFMLHRIRLAMQHGTLLMGISGPVEADETFIGGLARNMHKNRRAKKITGTGGAGKELVVGLLDRETRRVRISHVADRKAKTLHAEIKAYVATGAELYTDELASYTGLDKEYVHKVINHAEEYVRGNVHTNGIENFWSLLKRGIKGTYVSVEPFHLFRYLDEQAFRYNERKNGDGDQGRFNEVLRQVVGRRLTYKELIGADAKPTTAAPTTH